MQWHQPSDDAVARHLLRAVDGPGDSSSPSSRRWMATATRPIPTPSRCAARSGGWTRGGAGARRLRPRGELERTLVLLVSDHGAATVHTHLDLADWFRAQGVRDPLAPRSLGAGPARGRDGGGERLRDGLRPPRRAPDGAVAGGAAPAARRVRQGTRVGCWEPAVGLPSLAEWATGGSGSRMREGAARLVDAGGSRLPAAHRRSARFGGPAPRRPARTGSSATWDDSVPRRGVSPPRSVPGRRAGDLLSSRGRDTTSGPASRSRSIGRDTAV